ncbi:carboxypeptidase regulatory-like domain-containing protein [Paludibaculum fermentans]|uniref:TonB-dependent receptor n=1 Tax=Paludibaculum fermentans TaxID=1473598 RepID=UPI003EC0FBB3
MSSPCLRLVRNVAPLFLLSLIGLAAYGQGFGTIVGTVTDPTGAVVPSAKIRVTDEATANSRETTTNDQGYFVVPALRPALYTLTVESSGFALLTRKAIQLQADQNLTVNLPLSVQQSVESVNVSAESIQVDTTSATANAVVDQRRVVDLPLNGRNAASLLLVVPGAIPAPANDVDQGNTKTFPSVVTVSTNGSRQNQISFRLDGSYNNDIYTNVNQPFPFPDALQEFSVQTSNYAAKFGGNAGGVVNVVTKSGTNEYHGSGFEFVRNAEFNARNFFAAKRDLLKRNQFGGTVGGPISIPGVYDGKNRDFFFFGYQGTLIRNVGNTSSAYVPLTQNTTGDFSNVLSATDPTNPFSKATSVLDPTTGTPFAGNIIPSSRLDPAAVKFMKYIPVQGSGNGRIFYSTPLAQNFNEFLTRGDHTFSEKDRLSARYFYDKFSNRSFLEQANYLANSNYSTIISQNALVSETHMFSPSVINEFRASFSRETSVRGPSLDTINLADLGVNIWQPTIKALNGISVSGFFSQGQTDPASFIRNQYNLSNDVSWIRGKHNIAFGGAAIRGQVLLRNLFRTSGSFSFTADNTNDALASFMLGYVRTFAQGYGEYKDNQLYSYSLYVQDDYHASQRLTVNMGLRWEPFFPWHEMQNRMEQFSPADYIANKHSSVYTNAPAGLLFPGDSGMPFWGQKSNLSYFSPRAGFAYALTSDNKTSLRGGIGMFYDALQPGVYNNRFVDVTPFSPQISLTQPQGSFSNPYKGITNPYPAVWPPPKDVAFPGPVLVISYDPANGGKAIAPVIYNWNLIVERQLADAWVGRVAYVGSHGSHLGEAIEMNPAVYTAGSKLSADARRLFQPYGSISQASFDENSSFNSFQTTLQKHYSKGFTTMVNYTWSKSIDDTPANMGITGVAQGSNSPVPWYLTGRHQFDRGLSEFDHRHRMVASYVYDVPKLAGSNYFVRTALGGWQVSGIFTYQTGGPLTLLAGKDQSQTGIGSDRANYLGGDAYGTNACTGTSTCVSYLNPSAFGLPATGNWGNMGKGALHGPKLVNWDAGIFKDFPLGTERFHLQFRAEFFNVFNHANFNNPNVTQSAGGFGSITSAQDPRIGQLALKILF